MALIYATVVVVVAVVSFVVVVFVNVVVVALLVVTTGSFDRSVVFHTPIESRQKFSLRLILAEKSSLVHDIRKKYVHQRISSIFFFNRGLVLDV